jgi:hypothetical protein
MKLRTKRERAFRDNLKRAGVWIFLIVFVTSIVGVALVTAGAR